MVEALVALVVLVCSGVVLVCGAGVWWWRWWRWCWWLGGALACCCTPVILPFHSSNPSTLTPYTPPHTRYYHLLYGTLSTAAMASIAFGYSRKVRFQAPLQWALRAGPPPARLAVCFGLQALGLAGVAQSLPKLQSPYGPPATEESASASLASASLASASLSSAASASPTPPTPPTPPHPPPLSPSSAHGPATRPVPPPAVPWAIRCPFDFVDGNLNGDGSGGPRGLDRVSRHPGLWSFAGTRKKEEKYMCKLY